MDVNGNDNTPEWGYCDKDGCTEPAIPCWVEGGPPDDPDDCLCPEHCKDEGYCWGCGRLWAGCEDFDFDPRGLCPNCRHEFDSEYDDDDAEPWDFRYLDGPDSEFSERGT